MKSSIINHSRLTTQSALSIRNVNREVPAARAGASTLGAFTALRCLTMTK